MPDASLLPGYTFDARARGGGQYRNVVTGRYVARVRIQELLDQQVQQRAARLGRITQDFAAPTETLTRALAENRLTPAQWLTAMKDELRRAHIQYRALGAGGFGADKLTAHDYGKIGAALKDDYRRLVGFADAILRGECSEAQALARLNMYLGHARSQYYDAWKERVLQTVEPGLLALGRRRLGQAEHCDVCVIYARAGLQPLENMPPIGDSPCDGNCRCTLEVKIVPIAEAQKWIGGGDIPEWNAAEVEFYDPAYPHVV